jgi:nucleotide-binding universal stress UspA family protein
MKILMAVDGSEYTRRMLEYVTAPGGWLGKNNEITVLTVVPELPPRVRGYMNAAQLEAHYEQEAAAALVQVQAVAIERHWLPKLVHEVGHPATVIAQTAATGGFDLVVMGSHGHGALAAAVLGSVTAEVLARSTVPLLIVRHG